MSNLLNSPGVARFREVEPIIDLLEQAVRAAQIAAMTRRRERNRRANPRRFNAISPGPETPLWNALVQECSLHLGKFGSKATLGRVLGVPRQRVHQLIVARTACADAERTLQLLGWLLEQRRAAARRKK
jgi:hypothetical protein